MIRLALLLLLALTSCQKQRLSIETRFIGRQTLASSWVQTPDPRQYCPTTGQELTISWRLPEFDHIDNLHLLLSVRFGNCECQTCEIPIKRFRGCFTYSLLNEDYWKYGGIQTYKVELYTGEQCLDCWYHQIWSEMIDCDHYGEEEAYMDGPPWQL